MPMYVDLYIASRVDRYCQERLPPGLLLLKKLANSIRYTENDPLETCPH
jgi:hypothetical protein